MSELILILLKKNINEYLQVKDIFIYPSILNDKHLITLCQQKIINNYTSKIMLIILVLIITLCAKNYYYY